MTIIKLDAIDSTNDYLKQLAKEKSLENYTAVIAKEQTKGKGQLGAKWFSEPSKNLTMSVLINDLSLKLIAVCDINVAVAIATINTLKAMNYETATIKWPNDIMAENKKIGGILIENNFKPNGTFTAIVGIGLNLNQTHFENLPKATSLTVIMGKNYTIYTVAELFIKMLKSQIDLLLEDSDQLWKKYKSLLFKRDKVVAFEDNSGNQFMAIIKDVTRDGKLVLLQEDDQLHYYENKQIKMLF